MKYALEIVAPFGCRKKICSFYVSYFFTCMCYQLYDMMEFIETDILISLHINVQ